MTQESDLGKKIIFIPHYKGSFMTLLLLALFIRENNQGVPHFVLYFEDDSKARQTLKDHQIDFTIYKRNYFASLSTIGKLFRPIADLTYSSRLINRLSPVQAVVCAVENTEIEYALISVANKRNINTIVVQWAQTVSKEYYQTLRSPSINKLILYFGKLAKRLIEKTLGLKYMGFYGDGNAKYFAVMGDYYYDMFIKQGISKNKLVVTGHPEYDHLYKLSQKAKYSKVKQSIIKDFGFDHKKPLWVLAREAVVYFKLISEQKDKQDLRTILEILSEYHPQVQLVLKMHPRDDEQYYHFVRENFPHIVMIHDCDLYKLISACDLYISQISNTMMWAVALDKIVISYDFNNQPYWQYFRDKEAFIKVDTAEQFKTTIKTISDNSFGVSDPQKYEITKQKYMRFDGKACQRISNLITSL